MSDRSPVARLGQWFRERRKPALKCDRLGHVPMVEGLRIRKESTRSNLVAEDYEVKRDFCKRCAAVLKEPYDSQMTDGYSSCSMPSTSWDEIRKNGYLVLGRISLEKKPTNPMQEYQQRVVTEKSELDARLSRLRSFLATDRFKEVPEDEQKRLTTQRAIMELYSQVLKERIEAFE